MIGFVESIVLIGLLGDDQTAEPRLTISSSSVSEDADIGALIGTLSVSNGVGSYTFSITDDPDSKFSIDVDELLLADTVDFETATFHTVTIEATNGVDEVLSRQFTVLVINVAEGGEGGDPIGLLLVLTKAS